MILHFDPDRQSWDDARDAIASKKSSEKSFGNSFKELWRYFSYSL